MKSSILLFSMACLIAMPVHRQTKKELKQQKAAEEFAGTRDLVESGGFRFDAIRAQPSGGRSIDLSGHNNGYVEISNDSAKADLPYFGRAGNVAYSSDAGGIKIDGIMEGVNLAVKEDKQNINLTFSLTSGRDQFNCFLTISRGGSGTLSITSNLRSQISYNGQISPLKKE